jgi:hypothetical protein
VAAPFVAGRDGVTIAVRVTPKARTEGIDGVMPAADGAVPGALLKLRVKAAPEDGKANAAVIALLAKASGLPRGAFTLVAGHADRTKRIHAAGDPAALLLRFTTMLGGTT